MMGNNATPKDKDMYDDLEIVLEMYERGLRFIITSASNAFALIV